LGRTEGLGGPVSSIYIKTTWYAAHWQALDYSESSSPASSSSSLGQLLAPIMMIPKIKPGQIPLHDNFCEGPRSCHVLAPNTPCVTVFNKAQFTGLPPSPSLLHTIAAHINTMSKPRAPRCSSFWDANGFNSAGLLTSSVIQYQSDYQMCGACTLASSSWEPWFH
jgi:hypothetical protein